MLNEQQVHSNDMYSQIYNLKKFEEKIIVLSLIRSTIRRLNVIPFRTFIRYYSQHSIDNIKLLFTLLIM